MITSEQIFGCWTEFKGKLKEHWGELTESELKKVEGNVEQLIGLIQYKSGQARAQIESALAEMAVDPQRVTEAGRQYAQHAAEAAHEFMGDVQHRVREQYGQVEDVVRRRPAESVAVAFGTGIIAGVILGLISRSR